MAMQLSQLQHNEEVGSESDPAFRAYFAGSMGVDPVRGQMVMVVVKVPGKSGCSLYANKPWPLSDLRALPFGKLVR